MNYHGKNYLYDFLKEHGYDVPKLKKEMQYSFFRGSEWLKSDLLEAWSPKRDVILVTAKREGENHNAELERTQYIKGVIVFKKLNGSYVIV